MDNIYLMKPNCPGDIGEQLVEVASLFQVLHAAGLGLTCEQRIKLQSRKELLRTESIVDFAGRVIFFVKEVTA